MGRFLADQQTIGAVQALQRSQSSLSIMYYILLSFFPFLVLCCVCGRRWLIGRDVEALANGFIYLLSCLRSIYTCKLQLLLLLFLLEKLLFLMFSLACAAAVDVFCA